MGSNLGGVGLRAPVVLEKEGIALLRHEPQTGTGRYLYARLRGLGQVELRESLRLRAVAFTGAAGVRVVEEVGDERPFVMSGWWVGGRIVEMVRDALVVDVGFPLVVRLGRQVEDLAPARLIEVYPYTLMAQVVGTPER